MKFCESLLETLRAARRVVVLTGAGVSAESGLPTFRDKQVGLWERFDPAQLATREAFERDPDLVWGWYEWRRMQVVRAMPNPGHEAIVQLAGRVASLTLVTQNVDDLHERAGSHVVHHLHGRIAHAHCLNCSAPYALPASVAEEPGTGRRSSPPRCARCAGMIRPGVVWFGESLPQREWQIAERATRECEVFFCIGTSSTVFPAASLLPLAARHGAVTIQINPAGAAGAALTHDLRGQSGVVLPALLRQTWQ